MPFNYNSDTREIKLKSIPFFYDSDLYKVYLKDNVPKVKVEKIIKAEKDKVFSTMTDFENLPSKLPHIFKSIKVISQEGNSLITEEFVKMAGRNITQKVKQVIQPTEKHEVFILEGDANVVQFVQFTSAGMEKVALVVVVISEQNPEIQRSEGN